MSWRKRKRHKGQNRNYSLIKKLREEGKSSEEFEVFLNNLTLEEVIGLKLDLSSTTMLNGKMFGFPLWKMLPAIIKDAVVKYAVSATKSKAEAARFLGLDLANFRKILNRHKVSNYFEEENDDGL